MDGGNIVTRKIFWILSVLLIAVAAIAGATSQPAFSLSVPALQGVSSMNITVISNMALAKGSMPLPQSPNTAHGRKTIEMVLGWLSTSPAIQRDSQMPPSVINSGIVLQIQLENGQQLSICPAEDYTFSRHGAEVHWHHPNGMVDIKYPNVHYIVRAFSRDLDHWLINGYWKADMGVLNP